MKGNAFFVIGLLTSCPAANLCVQAACRSLSLPPLLLCVFRFFFLKCSRNRAAYVRPREAFAAFGASAMAFPLLQYMATLDGARLPRILRVCSGVYFQGFSPGLRSSPCFQNLVDASSFFLDAKAPSMRFRATRSASPPGTSSRSPPLNSRPFVARTSAAAAARRLSSPLTTQVPSPPSLRLIMTHLRAFWPRYRTLLREAIWPTVCLNGCFLGLVFLR